MNINDFCEEGFLKFRKLRGTRKSEKYRGFFPLSVLPAISKLIRATSAKAVFRTSTSLLVIFT